MISAILFLVFHLLDIPHVEGAAALVWHNHIPLNLVHRGILSNTVVGCLLGYCGAMETSQHLFISCDFYGSLWSQLLDSVKWHSLWWLKASHVVFVFGSDLWWLRLLDFSLSLFDNFAMASSATTMKILSFLFVVVLAVNVVSAQDLSPSLAPAPAPDTGAVGSLTNPVAMMGALIVLSMLAIFKH
ncbi:transmembrane protein, putative [Medicago truncatula]|uniref:Transmembrane protein, putative n=1 Tax=Medicago truncatula TaxID=3880 RepID=A0A072UUZ9_MEDTR|nr:transmembrane protein, putative [Medicago truncatula]